MRRLLLIGVFLPAFLMAGFMTSDARRADELAALPDLERAVAGEEARGHHHDPSGDDLRLKEPREQLQAADKLQSLEQPEEAMTLEMLPAEPNKLHFHAVSPPLSRALVCGDCSSHRCRVEAGLIVGSPTSMTLACSVLTA